MDVFPSVGCWCSCGNVSFLCCAGEFEITSIQCTYSLPVPPIFMKHVGTFIFGHLNYYNIRCHPETIKWAHAVCVSLQAVL